MGDYERKSDFLVEGKLTRSKFLSVSLHILKYLAAH